jgi:hypothetical protein
MSSYLNPISVGTGTALPGTGTAAAMPAEAAIVLTEQIQTRGRGMKGRVFIGGWDTSADAGAGLIDSTVGGLVTSFGQDVFTAISNEQLQPCVAQVARRQYQGLTGTVHAARNANHVLISSYALRDLNWDTQRRRGL